MTHASINRQKNWAYLTNKNNRNFLVTAFRSFFTPILFFLLIQNTAFSQTGCTPACHFNTTVYMDADCSVEALPVNFLTAINCPGNYWTEVKTATGVTVPNSIITGQYIGQTLMVTVFHESGNSCWSMAMVKDTTDPVISCSDVTVTCNQATTVAAIGTPGLSDNCSTASFVGTPVDFDFQTGTCSDPYMSRFKRRWTATDAVGNTAVCTQQITVVRPVFADIVWPTKRDTFGCNTVADTSITGYPKISGKAVGTTCNMVAGFNDIDTMDLCQNIEKMIVREWLVYDFCTMMGVRDTQYIVLLDLVKPTLTCPLNFNVPVEYGLCTADIASLPQAIVSDNCQSNVPVKISWSGGNHYGPYTGIMAGSYTLKYTAIDCRDSSVCTTTMTVFDNQPPVALCSGDKTIGLNSGGTSMLPKAMFDLGSYDNCDFVTTSVSRDGVTFGEKVMFTCADVNTTVAVILRVAEQGNQTVYTDCIVPVHVQDKLKPSFTYFPADMTVDCDYDYTNPLVGPQPVIIDNCTLDTVIISMNVQINDCHEGTVTRTYTAYDEAGNSASGVLTITVQNNSTFGPANIVWPPNYTTHVCGASLAIADLPTIYKQPTWTNPGCSQIALSYTEQYFDISAPACYKIMRKWTLTDLCKFNPMNPAAGGRWESTQILLVADGEKPVLTIPADVTVSVGSNCLTGFASLMPATATDCSPDLTITNNSAYAASQGENASGYYPKGVHLVTFRAIDGCGNIAQKTVKITVVDNVSPTVICLNGLSINVTENDWGIGARLTAKLFDGGSFDNCTPKSQLVYKIKKSASSDAPTDYISFDCSEVGAQIVQLWVTDLLGNTDYCETYVLIQDHAGLCGPASKSIAGAIETEQGEKIEDVHLMLPGYSNALPVSTDGNGTFAIPNLPANFSYTVKPEKDGDDGNGVSSLDLLLLNRHILGQQPLTTPYQLIAADANHSGTITTYDIVELRKLILGIYDSLPANTSWRFVEWNYNFPDPNNPFASAFPEVKTISNIATDSAAYFIGIKIGDLNSSAAASGLQSSDDRSGTPTMDLVMDEKQLEPCGYISLPVYPGSMTEIGAMQFTLDYDREKLECTGWSPAAGLPFTTDANFSFIRENEGKVTFCWAEADGAQLDPKQPLFNMHFQVKENVDLQTALRIDNNPTRALAYGPDGEASRLKMAFRQENGALQVQQETAKLYQNRPNPFTDRTIIGFSIPEAGKVELTVFDVTGAVVSTQKVYFEKGYSEWNFDGGNLPTGMYAYRIATDKWAETGKMIKH